jgi:flagellar assembly factor FliW
LINGGQNLAKMKLAISDPYAYGSDKKFEVRDKLLTDWAEIQLTKTTKMKTFCIGHITAYAWVLVVEAVAQIT